MAEKHTQYEVDIYSREAGRVIYSEIFERKSLAMEKIGDIIAHQWLDKNEEIQLYEVTNWYKRGERDSTDYKKMDWRKFTISDKNVLTLV
jgi:hypothetical protein